MALKPVTVTQLNEYISRVLGTDPLLSNISVTGEISNLKFHSSGHVYFSMIDQSSKVNCFLPASCFRNLAYTLGDGLNVTVRGYINVYKKGGAYTLFIRELEVAGEGDLSTAFELLKKKLQEEGLFDPSFKKKIPAFPKKIGILTSKTGAAVRDMVKIIQSRTKAVDVIIFPVPVQGTGAAAQMADMLDHVNENFYDIDTLIIGRGGGSAEDLWPFNEEVLARAIFRSRIPVISAVGHEIDFSISDFVADLRAETPTAAAEKAVPDDSQIIRSLDTYRSQLNSALKNKVMYHQMSLKSCIQDMRSVLIRRIDRAEHEIKQNLITLEENNPSNILSKGYTFMEGPDGKVVASASDMEEGGRYRIYFRDGTVEVTVSEIKEGGKIDF
ncbi:MAG TPA: exodeoxyribonuclease VII large subunit [Candidatus Fimisoma avicola]|uniref:Exodeoxyribonuclease 7 large subunit n=1 Tax=Candidatus Fimisoma avicola TaxID=2840826 RepID=A0A9D1I2W1_9FIRM|nr:exodeoxyribonuclease VII large subunit [Candidatus Fimisoma avicola]